MAYSRMLPAFALAAVGAVMGAASSAQAITLADLVNSSGLSNGATVTYGDFVFKNFSFTSTGLPASEIEVIDLGNGIGFEGDFSLDGGSIFASTISYTVESVDPIKYVGLSMATGIESLNTEELPGSLSIATLTLSPSSDSAPMSDGLSVISSENDWDDLALDPELSSLYVRNSITGISTGEVSAPIAFVGNYFETEDPRLAAPPPVIPEPASLVLLPLAMAGLAVRKKYAR